MRVKLVETEIIAPHFKRRLSGVTSTIIQLIPQQRKYGQKIATLGPGLPADLPKLVWWATFGFWRRPAGRCCRIWHARRNVEMAVGVLFRDLLRMRLKLVFTSASQRHHKPFTKWLIRRMDTVIATSKNSASYLDVTNRVIMHGIDLERFHPPLAPDDRFSASGLPGDYAIGCFGRVRHQKGTDLFIDAMIELLPKYPRWTAVFAGGITRKHEDFAQKLLTTIAKAGLSERIIYLGELSNLPSWYRRLTIYVAPSRHEGFGLTPLEAMASSTAVVTSDAGAYRELVPNSAGTVVKAGDRAALTAAIERYMQDPIKSEIIGADGLRHVQKHFPISKEVKAIAEVYEELFNRQN